MLRSFTALLFIAILAGSPVAGQDRQAEIRGVISRQIEAFQADDFSTAFEFASPSIQQIFRTPQNFGQMVMNGYPMIWRPSDVQYGAFVERDGRVYQRVLLRDAQGRGFVATYEMSKVENMWRINGVSLEPEMGAGA